MSTFPPDGLKPPDMQDMKFWQGLFVSLQFPANEVCFRIAKDLIVELYRNGYPCEGKCLTTPK